MPDPVVNIEAEIVAPNHDDAAIYDDPPCDGTCSYKDVLAYIIGNAALQAASVSLGGLIFHEGSTYYGFFTGLAGGAVSATAGALFIPKIMHSITCYDEENASFKLKCLTISIHHLLVCGVLISSIPLGYNLVPNPPQNNLMLLIEEQLMGLTFIGLLTVASICAIFIRTALKETCLPCCTNTTNLTITTAEVQTTSVEIDGRTVQTPFEIQTSAFPPV